MADYKFLMLHLEKPRQSLDIAKEQQKVDYNFAQLTRYYYFCIYILVGDVTNEIVQPNSYETYLKL